MAVQLLGCWAGSWPGAGPAFSAHLIFFQKNLVVAEAALAADLIMVGQMVGCRSSCVGNGLTAGSWQLHVVPDKLHYNGLKFYIFRQLLSYFEAAMIKSAASAASLAGRKNNKDLKASSFL